MCGWEVLWKSNPYIYHSEEIQFHRWACERALADIQLIVPSSNWSNNSCVLRLSLDLGPRPRFLKMAIYGFSVTLLSWPFSTATLPTLRGIGLKLVRFSNPLATGSGIHGSWGTWLGWNMWENGANFTRYRVETCGKGEKAASSVFSHMNIQSTISKFSVASCFKYPALPKRTR